MNTLLKHSVALATLAFVAHAQAQVTLYDREDFQGRSFSTRAAVPDLAPRGFNDRTSSIVVEDGPWQVCDDAGFRGRCVVLQAGRYSSLASTGIGNRVSSLRSMEISASDRPRPVPTPDGITFYENEGYAGRSFSADRATPNFQREGMNDRVSSVRVTGGTWQVCSDAQYAGSCTTLRPGAYPSLGSMGLNDRLSSARELDNPGRPPVAIVPAATFYAQENFRGRSFNAEGEVANLDRQGINRRVSSVVVSAGQWEVCDDARFRGRCMVLQVGRYPTLSSMGLGDRVASVRVNYQDIDFSNNNRRPQQPGYDARRRNGERLYQADVTSVREVRGNAEQRCWVEREPVASSGDRNNVPAAIAGALIGGILGHQVGGGTGKDLATAGGAIAGAVVGANIGRDGGQGLSTQDVQRCSQASGQERPSYWEVSYTFRGTSHRVQMSSPPASTVTVNEQGEPRV